MATGILGTPADLTATTNTTLYTVPATTFTIASVSLCNRSASSVTVRLALAASASPTNAEWIEYGATIPAYSVLERTGLAIDTGKQVVAYASAGSSISAMVYGIETSTS